MNYPILPMLEQMVDNWRQWTRDPQLFDLSMKTMRPIRWLEELGTITVRGPRQSGHTTAAMGLCSSFLSPLLVCSSMQMVHNIKDRFPKPKGIIAPLHHLNDSHLSVAVDFDAVIVDNASGFSEVGLEQIKEFTAKRITPIHPMLLVLIG